MNTKPKKSIILFVTIFITQYRLQYYFCIFFLIIISYLNVRRFINMVLYQNDTIWRSFYYETNFLMVYFINMS